MVPVGVEMRSIESSIWFGSCCVRIKGNVLEYGEYVYDKSKSNVTWAVSAGGVRGQ